MHPKAHHMQRFRSLFPQPMPLIGMISLPPLPGFPTHSSINDLIVAALADLEALEQGGAAAVLVENDFDLPHTLTGGAEIVAAMTRVTREVVAQARVPVGTQVLLNDWRASLAIALASGAQFIRSDFFVDRVQIQAGMIEPEADRVIAYRKHIGAEHVLIFADLQVKYSTPAGKPKPLEQSAREAAAAGADAVIITGPATGVGPVSADLRAAQAGELPILIGSGLTPSNAKEFLPLADGAIVGTYFRSGPGAGDRVVSARVRELVERTALHKG
jgi:membrane complex biogenesis BtpA family protein